jgi:hypothetical protein
MEYGLLRATFLQTFDGDYYMFGVRRQVRDSLANVITMVVQAITDVIGRAPLIRTQTNRSAYLHIDQTLLVTVEDTADTAIDMWCVADRSIHVSGYAGQAHILGLREKVQTIADESLFIPNITWHYVDKSGCRDTHSVQFSQPKPAHDEFYPWISGGVIDYFDRFMASQENILILLGETGTGKTSFIRNLIWHTRWNAAFTFDEQLLGADDLFVDFLTDDDKLLIVEDADLFLTSREHDGNRMMARFLNVSDGLLQSDRIKKIIFTANLTQPSRIDNALLREGRCFDCMVFRPLNYLEAIDAAEKAGIAPPGVDRDYTLAQLFAKQRRRVVPVFGITK